MGLAYVWASLLPWAREEPGTNIHPKIKFNNNLELADVSNSSAWWDNEFVTFSAGP